MGKDTRIDEIGDFATRREMNEHRAATAADLAGMEARLNRRFDGLEGRMDGLEKRMDGVETAVTSLKGDIIWIREKLEKL